MQTSLRVTMLGNFSVTWGDKQIDDSANRMRKVWLLISYMIYARDRRHTQEQYLSLISGSHYQEAEDPANRLKALLYRARTLLGDLGENAGHTLIVHKDGAYGWNTEIPLTLDVEEFDRLCTQAARETDESTRTALYQQAISLYQGDFLPKLSMESWVMPIHTYYHQMFLQAAEAVLQVLEAKECWQEVSALCDKALSLEPYSEALYQHKLRCRMAMGDKAGAVELYEKMSQLLFDTFGVMPSDESRRLYREALREDVGAAVAVDTVREHLRENTGARGAMFCEYDFFRLLYQVQARALIRSGDVIHIALLSVHGWNRQSLSRRSLDTAMDNLQELVLNNLRQGDVVTRCSLSQMILMLPGANYENGCGVCQRIVKAFQKQYPHSPAEIHYSVQPLEPTDSGLRITP